MATLISSATGNLTASGTWKLTDPTAELDSEAANTVLTTSYVASSAFTPGAIEIDAIAVKVASRAASPSGTMTVELYNSSGAASVAGTEVVINVSDVNVGDTAANGGCGWYVFAFAAPVTLIDATNYQVRAKTSASTQVNLFSSATSNWSRQLRTTTNQAPADADVLIISGQFTAAATSSTYTVTMDELETTEYDPTIDFGVITVNNKSILTYGVTASTNYYLKVSGDLDVYGGGIFRMGTSGSPMPSTSRGTLIFDSASVAQFGLYLNSGATMESFGNALTRNWTTLAADASASATSLTVAHTTNWLDTDNLGFASTTVTVSQAETKALTANASGTTLTVAALTNAHGGNASTGVRGHIVNLTRNVKIYGTTQTNTGFVVVRAGATVSFSHTEFRYLGSSTATKYGINAWTTASSGSLALNGCSHWQYHTGAWSFNIDSSSAGNITIDNGVSFDCGTYTYICNQSALSTITNMYINDFVGIKAVTNVFYFAGAAAIPLDDIVANACSTGMRISQDNGAYAAADVDGLELYSCSGSGLDLGGLSPYGTIQNLILWRNTYGAFLKAHYADVDGTLFIDNGTWFSNTNAHILLNANEIRSGRTLFNNHTFNAGTTTVTPKAVLFTGSYYFGLEFQNCTFGVTQSHTTADIDLSQNIAPVIFNNCTMASTTEVATQTGTSGVSSVYGFPGVASINHDQTAGNHKTWKKYGTLTTDTTIYNTASPSERITPNNATYKVTSGRKFFAVNSGQTATVTVYVRESVVGDGTDYNGSRIRLILRANAGLGITVDTVLDTATVSSEGAWEQLSGAVPSASSDGIWELYLDCNGTTGWINIDDWAVV